MPFTTTPLPGVIIFEPAVYPDDRGYFFESYNNGYFRQIRFPMNLCRTTSPFPLMA